MRDRHATPCWLDGRVNSHDHTTAEWDAADFAAAAALDALAKKVRGMPESLAPAIVGWGPLAGAVDRAAVLDAIKEVRNGRE